jgi:hypothetical protein
MSDAIARWHRTAVASPLLRVFTACTRAGLALGFLPSGWVKVVGHRFTTLPASDPVGLFFNGFFSAFGFYRFVGVAQVTAAILLLFAKTAMLGAALYFPIILSIFIITLSVAGFAGTRIVTGLMLLATVYLLLWDLDRWRSMLRISTTAPPRRHMGVAAMLILLAAAAAAFLAVLRLHAWWFVQRR